MIRTLVNHEGVRSSTTYRKFWLLSSIYFGGLEKIEDHRQTGVARARSLLSSHFGFAKFSNLSEHRVHPAKKIVRNFNHFLATKTKYLPTFNMFLHRRS